MLTKGVVVKVYGGFYYTRGAGNAVWECVLRGRFRIGQQRVLVGDNVEFIIQNERSGIIENVFPRKTVLLRPRAVNVEQAVIVMAARDPYPNPLLLDRFLIQAKDAGVKAYIVFNKIDLGTEEIRELAATYQKVGYSVFLISAKEKTGIDELREILSNSITVLAGPSGAGKSSLLNAVSPGLMLKTGAISGKAGTGRHTTRHVELLPLPEGGFVVDTPGFSKLGLPEVDRVELAGLFPEFEPYIYTCQFTGCLHMQEPGCAVKKALQAGEISSLRYNNYLKLLNEVVERERRYLK
ncbi:MAG: ribosome small subunit-dependent GTPase A [Eubacteriales bacterium]